MKTIKGDLLNYGKNGTFDVIIHGCNCQNTMGAGIAKSIKRAFPDAYKADQATRKGDRKKLGSYSSASVELEGHTLTVVNAYTQFHYGGSGVRADYNAIRKVFALIKQDFSGARIGYPLIGAGLARGDWSLISQIIEEELEGEDHTLVRFVP
jgi:O-acetyl-ADP-ribose deacetylase (regulator of RNase III)